MRKILAGVIVGGVALLGVGAKAAPLPLLPQPPVLAAPHVQAVDWDGWRGREWRRHEAWERERRREEWERWHRWHDARERALYYGRGW